MDCTQVFNEHRGLLFAIAYRMLGLVMDAEDMVQESFIKWADVCSEQVQSPKAYLSTIVTRLCLDQLRSARVKRETYIGEWLPEPLLTEPDTTLPENSLAQQDYLSTAFLVMLERLSPTERAVFLLREVFEYDYSEIAAMLDKTEANCRQLMRRARQHIDDPTQRFAADLATQERIMQQFIALASHGDMNGLLALLREDVVSHSDGGGKVAVAQHPIIGAEKVARMWLGLWNRFAKLDDKATFTLRHVNGQISLFAYLDGALFSVTTFAVDAQNRITDIFVVANPDKLAHLP